MTVNRRIRHPWPRRIRRPEPPTPEEQLDALLRRVAALDHQLAVDLTDYLTTVFDKLHGTIRDMLDQIEEPTRDR